ncbi:MAG TPA: 1-acyl-sn-glycerol-3-phosphate acyltransferase [Actinobacteria bacterium]|nr:1-acyl-sn-glycerol-3-phosphate acyltransferase [Actinomycetota bacterium]
MNESSTPRGAAQGASLGSDRPGFMLPGGRMSVEHRGSLPRAALAAARLLGPAARHVVSAGRKADCATLHRRERRWARGVVSALGIELTIRGLDRIAPGERYVVAPLHEGFADPVALMHLPLNLTWMARAELQDWKMLGRYLAATDQLVVDPEHGDFRELVGKGAATFDRGDNLVVFPQGSILGIELAFRPGAFWLAERLNRPVLPVVLTGGHMVWEHPFSPLLRFGQSIEMDVLEPIPAGEARAEMASIEARMRAMALTPSRVQPRRYAPERDGYWDGYGFEISPDFPRLAALVAAHRARGLAPDASHPSEVG